MATLVTDNFARTSANTPGTAQTGQAWRAELGTWGTDGDSIYSVTASDNDQLTIECGTENQDITVTIKTGAATGGLYPELFARWSDVYNGYWAEISADGSIGIRHWASFNSFGDAAPAGTVKNGDVIRFTAFTNAAGGCDLKVYVNGSLKTSGTDTDTTRRGSRMGFRHGAGSGSGQIKWSALSVADQSGAVVVPPDPDPGDGGTTPTPSISKPDSTVRYNNTWVNTTTRIRINNVWFPSTDGSTGTTPGTGTGGSGAGTVYAGLGTQPLGTSPLGGK